MKKILFFFILIFCLPLSIYGINGNGTWISPYWGPLTQNMNWSGKVYISDDITIDGYTLTIAAGSTIVSKTVISDIIITGTGVLIASGSSSSMIRFTVDYDNDGNYGEKLPVTERWGHISFQNMTTGFNTPSILNYCIVEFGQKNGSPWTFETSGGGIQAAYSYLTISNSIIRNNSAGWGGGIYVNINSSPIISNCYISNNIAGTTGGGMSIYQHSASVVTNCIIEKNTCIGGGGGGGLFVGDYPDNVKIYNCTIVSNVSTIFPGNNVRIWKYSNSTGPRFYNTLVWGSNNPIGYYSGNISHEDFNHCAIQGYTSGYDTCFYLDASNTNINGPNFYNITAGSEDYRIKSVSPCRNNGITRGAPTIDYRRHNRQIPYDIGAFESILAWTGVTSTDWSTGTNWEDGVEPSTNPTTDDIFIPGGLSNYPVINPPDLTIGASNTFVIEPGGKVTTNSVTNNGNLILRSDSTGIASLLIQTGYSGTGTQEIQLFIKGGGGPFYNWHYVAVTQEGLSTSFFTNINQYNLLAYDDSRVTISDFNGWSWWDGYGGEPGIAAGGGFTTMSFGRGYNFYNPTNATIDFKGMTTLGTTLGSITLQYSGSLPGNSIFGYNLLGNSLTCSLNWDNVTFNGSVNQAVYYTTGNEWASYIKGAGGTNGGTKDIPPLQGFFVKANDVGASVDFSNARQHSNQTRYKKSLEELKGLNNETIFPKVKMELKGNATSDETILWFNDKATTGFDEQYDGYKLFSSEATFGQVYSILDSINYVIDGIPLPADSILVPLGLKIPNAGNYSLLKKDYVSPGGYHVLLIDKANNSLTVDLGKTDEYSFYSDAGTIPDRFVIKIVSIYTGIDDPVVLNKDFNIYGTRGIINIIPMNSQVSTTEGEIKIYDLTGRIVKQVNNVDLHEGSLVQIPLNKQQGIYMVEVKAGSKNTVGKIFLY